MKKKMERFFGTHQLRYACRLAGIMLITSLFSFLLHWLGIGKENILMLFYRRGPSGGLLHQWLSVWSDRVGGQRDGFQLSFYGAGANLFHFQPG